MRASRWQVVFTLLGAGILLGAAGIVATVEINHYTSTETFCTSCHSMANLATDAHYLQSAHRNNTKGVRPNCADCHIPKSNLFTETYIHVTSGARDVFAELTNNFNDSKEWEKRRVVLAHEVRGIMRRQDSLTCRSCHAASNIQPVSERGQAAHALQREGRMTCIDCHFNLVHAPVPPTISFIRQSGIGAREK